VGRALPDARVPGLIAAPKPKPRRAMARPTNNFVTGFLAAGNDARGSGTARRPRRRIRRCAHAHAASSHGSTHEQLPHWIPRRWQQPPWVGHCPTPMVMDASLRPCPRSVEPWLDPRKTSRLDSSPLATTPWVGHCPTPALLDASLCPCERRVEPWLDPRKTSRLDSSPLKTAPVGRALPDARVPAATAPPPTPCHPPGAASRPRPSGSAPLPRYPLPA
jgi:hypothetical protein